MSESYDFAQGAGELPQPVLNSVKTLMAMTFASRATPYMVPPLDLPLVPAAIPATCVPCPHPEMESEQSRAEFAAVEEVTPPGQSEVAVQPAPQEPLVE
jgi:hypothetical protein